MVRTQKLSLDDLQRYYQEVYQPDQLVSLIGLADFRNREFGFLLPDDIFMRNISFRSPSAIKEFLSTRVPVQANIGAVYDNPPSKETPILQLDWKYRELVFDIDLNEYDAVRTCGCIGANAYCIECWSLMNDAMLFIDDTLRNDFGFTQLVWFYSGRRGVHLWVFDEDAKYLTQDARTAILNYLSMIRGDARSFQIEPLPLYAQLFKNRIYELIVTSYVRNSSYEELQSQGLRENEVKILKDGVLRRRFTGSDFSNSLPTEVDPKKFIDRALLMRYPRIDRSVTFDTRHLLRMVGTVHSGTGRICTLIEDIADFSPDMAPTVWDLLR